MLLCVSDLTAGSPKNLHIPLRTQSRDNSCGDSSPMSVKRVVQNWKTLITALSTTSPMKQQPRRTLLIQVSRRSLPLQQRSSSTTQGTAPVGSSGVLSVSSSLFHQLPDVRWPALSCELHFHLSLFALLSTEPLGATNRFIPKLQVNLALHVCKRLHMVRVQHKVISHCL